MEQTISFMLMILGLYLGFGLLFAIAFLWKGVTKVDEGTRGTGLVFKLLILPGTVAFWPVLLRKWMKTT